MKVLRYIANELREVSIVSTHESQIPHFEIVMYMYKPKDPVYYAFRKGSQYDVICNGLTYNTCFDCASYLILKNGSDCFWKHPIKKEVRKFNYIKLKLLKILK